MIVYRCLKITGCPFNNQFSSQFEGDFFINENIEAQFPSYRQKAKLFSNNILQN